MQTLSSGFVHRHLASANEGIIVNIIIIIIMINIIILSSLGTGKHSIQELECEAHFCIELYEKSKLQFELQKLNYCGGGGDQGRRKSSSDHVIFGRPWPETILLDSFTFAMLSQVIIILS
jgi:hypothetical protein